MSDRRQPRVGTNAKNSSSDIFKFGGCMDYEQGAAARYDRTSVSELEKRNMQQKRDKEASRFQARRNMMATMEQNRWSKMAQDYCKKEQDWLNRHSHTMGKNSVSYNPITLEYHKNSDGNKLRQDDAKALYRTSIRAANLYLKNNTFDPLRCQDIPRRIVVDPNAVAPATDTGKVSAVAKSAEELNIPKQLAQVAAQRAYVVKTRVDNADKVFMAESARVVNGKNGVAAAGTARTTILNNGEVAHSDAIVVEMDGNGRSQHSWTRHC
ncbi:hypothetical protein HDU78_001424 [Chytriomyces hyalinus]|nr:hypothetical protein HDU78_001424 [Chytriomyces hyalinus]